MRDFEIKPVDDHVEVFMHGQFIFSADTVEEAWEEIWEGEK